MEIDKYKPETVDVESTELNVQVQLGDVPFRGIIDLVHREDGNLIISDFKSGKTPKTARDEDEGDETSSSLRCCTPRKDR